MAKLPFISVVVPVLNREKTIGRCVESLLAMDYPDFEVIVIDNGSTDRTRDIISRTHVTMIVEDEGGAYAARNAGIRASRSEIVAFTDSDCTVNQDWLARIAQHYKDETVGGVGGHLVPERPANLVEEFLSFGPLRIFRAGQTTVMKKKDRVFLSGALGSANMSYRREVLEEAEGFDPDFAVFCGAYDLCWRVQRAGHKVIYEPQAVVRHKLRGSLPGLVKQHFLFGKYQPLLLKKQPGGFSYLKVRTYLFRDKEVRLKLPVRLLLNLDLCHLLPLGILLMFFHPVFLYGSLLLLAAVFGGAWRRTREAVRRSGKLRWVFLFPLFHLLRIYSLTAGRMLGGIRHKVISW